MTVIHTAAPMVESLDLNDIAAVDSHMHPLTRSLISTKYAQQRDAFVGSVMPAGAFDERDAVHARLSAGYQELVMGISRRPGYFNYVARNYGVEPTIAGFDSVLSRHIDSDEAFTAYIRSILDRERIATVVLESAQREPVVPTSLIPPDRFVWTYPITPFTIPKWAVQEGFETIEAVTGAIDAAMTEAVRNGCRGFKNLSAYQRTLALGPVSAARAQEALAALRTATPISVSPFGAPLYETAALNDHLLAYGDYLYKHIYLKAGQLQRPIIIHTVVVLHPALRIDLNDPRPLYAVFMDPDVVRAGTEFVLIHTGFPAHAEVAAMISQFPNVYVDLSHISKYPGALEETLRILIGVGPAYKIMYGSDSGSIPEETGYCVWNTRSVLARILSDYRRYYGWTQADVTAAAEQILHGTARRLFRISS